MLTVDLRCGDQTEHHTNLASVRERLHETQSLFWVDLTSPDDAEWEEVADLFDFHPLAIEDARKQDQRPKLEDYDTYLFLALRAWRGEQSPADDVGDVTEEIDIFFGPNYLVTIHEGDSKYLSELRRRWKVLKSASDDKTSAQPYRLPRTPALLLHTLLDTVVDAIFPVMDKIDEDIDDIETQVYSAAVGAIGTQKPLDLVPALRFKKQLLLLRQTVAPLRDILNELLRMEEPLIQREMHAYFQDVYDHTLRLLEQIDLHRDIVSGVMDAIMAQTNNRLNQVMKTLTVISTMLMSASLIAGIYGMNFRYMPELQWQFGYFGALGLMAVVSAALALYFKRIGWF
ncbi:MAG: magnesium/cobalt transporter CorA [Armatimonadota bacterium]